MKFQKGVLTDEEEQTLRDGGATFEPVSGGGDAAVPDPDPIAPDAEPPVSVEVEKNRLFQTLQEETGSERKYLRVLGIVAVLVLVAGSIVWYLMRPGVGDKILGPKGLEVAIRDHFLTKEKRTATDIAFFNCGDHTWARVGVEVRPDIKTNPIYQVAKYSARASALPDGSWQITAAPITSPEMDVPCR
jgi:hypothetical protein